LPTKGEPVYRVHFFFTYLLDATWYRVHTCFHYSVVTAIRMYNLRKFILLWTITCISPKFLENSPITSIVMLFTYERGENWYCTLNHSAGSFDAHTLSASTRQWLLNYSCITRGSFSKFQGPDLQTILRFNIRLSFIARSTYDSDLKRAKYLLIS